MAVCIMNAIALQLLLCQLLGSHRSAAATGSMVVDRCQYLMNGSVELSRICSSSVNDEIFVKARSPLIAKGEPTTLFIDRSSTIVFATLSESKLHSCDTLHIMQRTEFKCSQAGEVTRVKLEESVIYCFPHHMYMGDLVLDSCDRRTRKLYWDIVRATKMGAIQFSWPEASRAVDVDELQMAMLLLTLWLVALNL